jgi:protein-tyrosine phosphatase
VAPARGELERALDALRAQGTALPELDVAAEHLFDDVTWELFTAGQALPYPGGRAALVEFPYDSVPLRVEVRLWRLAKRGITPVLAHPERCAPLQRDSDRLEEILGAGAKLLLDVMSLTGAYGTQSRLAAERMLRAGVYAAACSDAHKPADVERVAESLDLLARTAGHDAVRRLLIEGPRAFVSGRDA